MSKYLSLSFFLALAIGLCSSCSDSVEDQFEQLQASQRADADPIIFAAIRNKKPELVEFAIKKRGAKIEQKDYYGNTPILAAAEVGNVSIMKILVAAGANLKVTNKYGAPIVHVLAEYGHAEALKFLLERGLDINERNLSGSFMYGPNGASGFSSEVDSMIKQAGSNPVSGNQAIHIAAGKGNVEIVKLLIASGVDPNSKNLNGKTPLDFVDMKRLVEMGDKPKGNLLAVARIYNPSQQETPLDQRPKTNDLDDDLQERYFGK